MKKKREKIINEKKNEIVILLSSSSEHIVYVCSLSDLTGYNFGAYCVHIDKQINTYYIFQQCAMVYKVIEHDTKLNQKRKNQTKSGHAMPCHAKWIQCKSISTEQRHHRRITIACWQSNNNIAIVEDI